ncbi:MAG: zinc-dependent alcohol dehydrogenase family protein [Rhodospirillaceae bacterium]|nr:zinc-dependent alcohol dehydrogenase family protein [Rhodospirillaceae bacterium]MBT4426988.1 zinc-dependent alcohol dehydrogenase family protein [Rhodospirillaceae bacterium]MBT5037450.1 zinc-dependent alcohol dehydrogenase family protein [Rhodospirillaceae bacterium]MBT5779096.1 zinc-dependent alcohol dehydrogenase family protein [Rhodospirillaceae bacterium]MBT6828411.1 zinc-dependent alcohol dehydrogenase family protein [Rhodospirillaceae bacterium]
MKAQIIRAFGGPELFEEAVLPDPEAGAGEVLVRVHASSVNPVDYKVRAAGPEGIAPALPAVLGCDIAGEVIALGAGVGDFKVGDAVYGCAGGVIGMPGGYAELFAADARLLAHKPKSLDMREAAALPLVTITAWEGLFDRANLEAGQSVLVHGGAGGVGHAAIQLAKAKGAKVYATVSSAVKGEIARGLGADDIINYRDESVEQYVERLTGGKGFDLVYDATGGDQLELSFEAARISGQVVTIVSQFTSDLTLMHIKGLSLHVVFMLIPMLHDMEREAHGKLLHEAGELAEAGKLRPLIDERRFTLGEIADAHRHLEAGQAVGKVVIDIATD